MILEFEIKSNGIYLNLVETQFSFSANSIFHSNKFYRSNIRRFKLNFFYNLAVNSSNSSFIFS